MWRHVGVTLARSSGKIMGLSSYAVPVWWETRHAFSLHTAFIWRGLPFMLKGSYPFRQKGLTLFRQKGCTPFRQKVLTPLGKRVVPL